MNKPLTSKEKLVATLVLSAIILAIMAYVSKSDYVLWVFYAVVVFSGTWMFLWVSRSILNSVRSKNWRKVQYKVIEEKISMRMGRGGSFDARYFPFFKIEYEYDGRIYTRTSDDNLNLSMGRVFSTPHGAKNYIDSVKNHIYGSEVFVNPRDPGIAFLRTGVGRDQIGILVFSIILILLPVLTLSGVIEWR
jgi:hypothetical protein